MKKEKQAAESPKEDAQQRYLELQMLSGQLQQIQQQIETLNQQLVELTRIKEALDDIKKTKKETEMLTQLGSGVFLKSTLKDAHNVLLNVGANIVVEKQVDDAIQIVEKQIQDFSNVIQEMGNELNIGIQRIQQLQNS